MSEQPSISVLQYLQRAANTPNAPSVLDAVMGEDWAVYKAGNARKAQQILYAMNQQRNRRSAGAGLAFRVGRQSPQALVKLINKGGAINSQGLKAQMEYLEKDGTVVLQRSEGVFGLDVDEDQKDLMAQAWGLKDSGKSAYPMTSHFVVSFPIDTDPEAAARAGRAWAERMFDSGALGERFDYYTADHRDTAHPHTHVVVSRRGLENGQWLKVSRRSLINYDSMRQLQVEVAAEEGIHLEATPRLARGVHERPVPDARIRAEAERRGPAARAPEHTEITAMAAAATILEFSRQIETEAKVIETTPAVAQSIARIVALLRAGHQITARTERVETMNREMSDMSEQYEKARTAITDSFRAMDRDIAEVADPAERVALQRQTAELRSEAALLLPDDKELQSYRSTKQEERYVGIRTTGGGLDADAIRDEAFENASRLAAEAGLDPDDVAARYSQQRASEGLVRQWRMLDMAQRARSRQDAKEAPETAQEAGRAIDLAHTRISEEYRMAETRLAGIGVTFSEDGPGDQQGRQQPGQQERDALVSDIERRVGDELRDDRYTIYDPMMNTEYRFNDFDEATEKADELGAGRIMQQREGAAPIPIRKVDNQWERPSDEGMVQTAPVEGLVVARGIAMSNEQKTPNGVRLAEELSATVEDVKSGRLSAEDERRAEALVRDTVQKFGPQIRAALDRDDTNETPSYQSTDPEADRREADRFEQQRRAAYDRIEREYGSDVVQTLSRGREKDDGLEQERSRARDANDQPAKMDRQRGRDRDDDGFGF
ncbi:relaxase/mobilization nuclease domain-containing protein [Roseobacter litoralis]|uniref:relaxase/mobilization nuclease domain-containing protein n=1 Tax=Roseobacter litoralis TaxID=42443 RepID=UPI00248F73BD|nr:relaxase/mobilization nuclease domain-containing protein [Roseobacter litoralis]